jgi:2-hydroxychromene-2-carboxylate isomerase
VTRLDFWFEFASTYSYPAASRVGALARDAGVTLRFRPFLLGPIFKAQGWNDSPFNIYPAKGRYMWRDLERVCAALSLPLRRPSQFPRNGLLAARVATGLPEQSVEAFAKRVYRASFAEDRDIAEPGVIADCLDGVVPDPAQALEAAQDGAIKARLRETTDEAVELGIFGAPTCSVGRELFWGNDRLEAAVAAARAAGRD